MLSAFYDTVMGESKFRNEDSNTNEVFGESRADSDQNILSKCVTAFSSTQRC
jgi:hypothetical protein